MANKKANKKTNKKSKHQIKSGNSNSRASSKNNLLWKKLFSDMGNRLGDDIDKRLKITAQTIADYNNNKIKKLENRIEKLEEELKGIQLEAFFKQASK